MSAPRISRGPMAAEVLGRDYTQVSNQLFRDARIHAKSKGVFGFLATHRDGFGVSPESIAAASADGISAVKSALRELEQYGYLTRSQTRTTDGTMGDTTYRITDMPSSEPVDGNRPPVPTGDDAQNPRSQPVDGNPLAVHPPAVDRPHKKTIPLKKISSEEKTTSSSVAEVSEDDPPEEPDVTDGGGGGDSDLRSTAEHITASLDYQGQVPDRQQRKTLTARLLAALEAGWSVDGLAVYLHLGSYRPDHLAAFYIAKLAPDRLPPAAPAHPVAAQWQEATLRAQDRLTGSRNGGTDDTVAGWGDVARQLAVKTPHRPYTSDAWTRPADTEATRVAWCGHWDCDPVTRMRDHDIGNGLKTCSPCTKCHPDMQF